MKYQMQDILAKCDADDFRILAKMMSNYFSFTDDKTLRREIEAFAKDPSVINQNAVSQRIEKQLRYFGSSDVAYAFRHLRGIRPGGTSPFRIVNDLSKRLKIRQRPLGSLESRLERLVKAVAEKTFFSLKPEQQRELFDKAGISREQQRIFFERLKEHKALLFPLLLSILGREVVVKLVESLAITVIGQFLGREAAKELVKLLATRFPWWSEWLGPIVWAISLSWLAWDLQGPAYRKTAPVLIYLGLVGLRDGPEDNDFWESKDTDDDD